MKHNCPNCGREVYCPTEDKMKCEHSNPSACIGHNVAYCHLCFREEIPLDELPTGDHWADNPAEFDSSF